MDDELLIYVKSEQQKNELKEKYPHVNANFVTIEGSGVDEMLPLVCINKKGKEACEYGEKWIDEFSKEP